MKIKNIIDEDFVNYKDASMVVAFPRCNGFKCGKGLCQNSPLATSPDIEIESSEIVKRYMDNNLTSAVVFAGLDPLDTFDEMIELVGEFRKKTTDEIIIYTGYYHEEIEWKIEMLKQYKNIIVKFGRFKVGQEKHYDDVLGVFLSNKEQYAEKIS